MNSLNTVPALLNRVSAGKATGFEPLLELIDLNEFLARNSDAVLFLKIEGDSMVDVPIRSGDWVILDRLRQPQPNNIIVARLGDGYTIKRYKPNGVRSGLYLIPANGDYVTQKISITDDCEILGVVTFVIHQTA